MGAKPSLPHFSTVDLVCTKEIHHRLSKLRFVRSVGGKNALIEQGLARLRGDTSEGHDRDDQAEELILELVDP